MIYVAKYKSEAYSDETNNEIEFRLGVLNNLGFVETVPNSFKLDKLGVKTLENSITMNRIMPLSRVSFMSYIEELTKALKTVTRSCTNCKFSTLCFAYNDLKKVVNNLLINKESSTETPRKAKDVVDTLAQACLMYKENN